MRREIFLLKVALGVFGSPRRTVREVTAPERYSPDPNDEYCVFAHFDPRDEVADYVLFYIEQIRMNGFRVVFSSSCNRLGGPNVEKLHALCDAVILRENKGYDFCSWRVAFDLFPGLFKVKGILFANDSVFGPFFGFQAVVEKLRNREEDVIGMTESYEIAYHLQSYFLYFSGAVARSRAFRRFIRSIQMLDNKLSIIELYEIGMSRKLRGAGFSVTSLFSVSEHEERNPTLMTWRQLINDHGFPFVKRSLISDGSVLPEELADVFADLNVSYPVAWMMQFRPRTPLGENRHMND